MILFKSNQIKSVLKYYWVFYVFIYIFIYPTRPNATMFLTAAVSVVGLVHCAVGICKSSAVAVASLLFHLRLRFPRMLFGTSLLLQ